MTSKIKMASKLVADTQKPTYDEFEPFCNWQREEDRDTLVLHLPEFKKEQLKVQISNLGVLKISGERPVNAQKRSRFHKETKVAKECNANAIHAKYVNGLLYVVMPKTKPPGPENEEAPIAQEQAQTIKQSTDQTSPDDQANTMPTSEEKTFVISTTKCDYKAKIFKYGNKSCIGDNFSFCYWGLYIL